MNNRQFTIKLSEKDLKQLGKYAGYCGMSKSAYMRYLIRGYVPKVAPPYNYYLMTKELNRIGGNLNQIAATANAEGIIDAHKYKVIAGYLFEQIAEIKKAVSEPVPVEEFPTGDN